MVKTKEGYGTNKLPYLTHRIYGSILSKHDKCEYCGDKATLVHHRSFDRTDNGFSNMAYSCDKCHNHGHALYDPTKCYNHSYKTQEEHVNYRHDVTLLDIACAKSMGLTLKEAAEEIGCGVNTIIRRLKIECNNTWGNI